MKVIRLPIEKTKVRFVTAPSEGVETLEATYSRLEEKPNYLINGGHFYPTEGPAVFNFIADGVRTATDKSYKWGIGEIDGQLKYGNIDTEPFNGFVSGYPNLIDNYEPLSITYAQEVNYKAERTALGYDDNDIIIMVFDTKCKFVDVQKALVEEKVKYAVLLDGGGSTRILEDGKAEFISGYSREVANSIAFYVEEDVQYLYRVQVGAYSNKDNAERMLELLKKDGYDGYIKMEERA